MPSDRTRPGRRSGKRGFTLIESLVALGIFAIALSGIIAAVGSALATRAARMERAWLTEFARSVVDEYVTTQPRMGDAGEGPGDLRWSAETAAAPRSGFATSPDLVEVTVRAWRASAPGRPVQLSTLFRRPPP